MDLPTTIRVLAIAAVALLTATALRDAGDQREAPDPNGARPGRTAPARDVMRPVANRAMC